MWGPQDTTGARGSILICLEQTEETAVLPQSDNLHGKQIPAELKDFFKQINNELAKVVDKEIWMSSDIIFVMRTDLPPPRRGRQPNRAVSGKNGSPVPPVVLAPIRCLLKLPVFQKMDRLTNDLLVLHQKRMTYRHGDVIGHSLEFGRFDRDFSVIGIGKHC